MTPSLIKIWNFFCPLKLWSAIQVKSTSAGYGNVLVNVPVVEIVLYPDLYQICIDWSLFSGQSETEAALCGAVQAPSGLGAGYRRPGQEQQRGVLLQDAAILAGGLQPRLQEELHGRHLYVFNQLRGVQLLSGPPQSAGKIF